MDWTLQNRYFYLSSGILLILLTTYLKNVDIINDAYPSLLALAAMLCLPSLLETKLKKQPTTSSASIRSKFGTGDLSYMVISVMVPIILALTLSFP